MANILGIKTGEKSIEESKKLISIFYKEAKANQIVTPNPEIILQAQKDEELFYILNKANLSLADGFGLKLAALVTNQKLFRYTGADFLPILLQEAHKKNRKILIINKKKGLSTKNDIGIYLKNNYPNINYLIFDLDVSPKLEKNTIQEIKNFSPDLAICLFGSPDQEKFIHQLQAQLNQIKIGVSLGGAFDFLTKKAKRAPKTWRFLGIEWLWRLIHQPKRWKRIWRATIVFSLKFIYWAFIMPNIYRSNVAILIYRKTKNGREILIVERSGEKNHWQIPQGGTDGLSLVDAGVKEVKEELGISKLRVKAKYKNLYKYTFDKELGKYKNLNNKRHLGYKGQKQSLLILEFLGSDDEIKINYWDHSNWQWVKEGDFIDTIHELRKEASLIYLNKLKKIQ